MQRKTKWRIGFLGMTALVIAMELYAVFDGDGQTEPWTTLIVQYIPHQFFFAALAIGVLWVLDHFLKYYNLWYRKR